MSAYSARHRLKLPDWLGYASALVLNCERSSGPSLPLHTEPGESLSDFVDRICDEVEEYYGARPKNERELKERADE